MSNMKTETESLLRAVEVYHKRPIRTTVDFEALSTVIEHQTNERISASTLKRMWGYVSDRREPRRYTLDVLSQYIGHRDFDVFCDALSSGEIAVSEFFTSFSIDSVDLAVGAKIEIGWMPNRHLLLEYLGENEYIIREAQNSKLLVGDRFFVVTFMLQYPLYIPSVHRSGESLGSFVAGKDGGLTVLCAVE